MASESKKHPYAPQNDQHFHTLEEYEKKNQNGISPFAWRQIVNYAALPINLLIALQTSHFLRANNLMHTNNFGMVQYFGIIAVPIVATIKQWPLALNDFFYNLFSVDLVFNDVRIINQLPFVKYNSTSSNADAKSLSEKNCSFSRHDGLEKMSPPSHIQDENTEDESIEDDEMDLIAQWLEGEGTGSADLSLEDSTPLETT